MYLCRYSPIFNILYNHYTYLYRGCFCFVIFYVPEIFRSYKIYKAAFHIPQICDLFPNIREWSMRASLGICRRMFTLQSSDWRNAGINVCMYVGLWVLDVNLDAVADANICGESLDACNLIYSFLPAIDWKSLVL